MGCPYNLETGEFRSSGISLSWKVAVFLQFLDCPGFCLVVVAPVVKNPPANAGDVRDSGSILGSGRSPGGWQPPLQYSCLENPMDVGA